MLAVSPLTVDDELVAEKLDRTAYSGLRSILLRLADVTERAGRVFNELNAETNAFHERTDSISLKYQQLQHYFTQSPASAVFDDTSHAATHIDQDVKDQDSLHNDAWTRPPSAGVSSVQRNTTPSPTPSARRAAGLEKVSPRSAHLADYYRKGLTTGSDVSQPASVAAPMEPVVQDIAANASDSIQKQSQGETSSVQRNKSFVGKSLQKSKATWVAQHGPLRDAEAAASKKHVTESQLPTGPLTRHMVMSNITNTNLRQSTGSKVWSQGSGGDGHFDSPRLLQTMNIPFSQEQKLRASLDPDFRQAVRQMSAVMQSSNFGKHELGSGHPHTVSLPFGSGYDIDASSPRSGVPDGETTRERLQNMFGLATQVANMRGHGLPGGSINALRESGVSQVSQESAQSPGTQQQQQRPSDPRMSPVDLQQVYLKLRPISPTAPFPGSGPTSHLHNQDPSFPSNTDPRYYPASPHDPLAASRVRPQQQQPQQMLGSTQQPNPRQSPVPPGQPWAQDLRPSSATPSHHQYPAPNTSQGPGLSPRKTPDQEDSQPFLSPRQNFADLAPGASPSARSEYFDPQSRFQSPAHRPTQPRAGSSNPPGPKPLSQNPDNPHTQNASPSIQPAASPQHPGYPAGPSSQYGGSNRGAQGQQPGVSQPASPYAAHERQTPGHGLQQPVPPLAGQDRHAPGHLMPHAPQPVSPLSRPEGSVSGHSMHHAHPPSHVPQPQGYNSQQPGYNQQQTGHSQQPGYNQQQTGHKSQQPGYNPQHTGHKSQQPGYNPQHTGHNSQQAGYNPQHTGHITQQPGYNPQQGSNPQHTGHIPQQGYNPQHTGHNPPQGYNSQKTGYNPQDPRQQGFAGQPGRPGPPSGQWSGSGLHDPRQYSQSGTPSSQMHGRSPVPSGVYPHQMPPGASPHSMVQSGRYSGPPSRQISQPGAPVYPGQSGHPGQQIGPGPPYGGQHSLSWNKQGPPPDVLQNTGPLRKARPVNSMNQQMLQRGPPGPRPYPTQQHPSSVQHPYPPGVAPPHHPPYPGAPTPGQQPYPGSSSRPQGGPHWQQPQPLTPPTATTQAGNSPFAPSSWAQAPPGHELDASRRGPPQGAYLPGRPSVAGGPGSLGHAQRSVHPEQPPSPSPQQPQSLGPPTMVPAPFAPSREMPAASQVTPFPREMPSTSMGVPAQPTAANLASMQIQQQAQQRPQTAMSNTSHHTTTSVAAAAAAGAGPAFYLAAKAVKSGQSQVSPRSTASNGQPSNANIGRAASVRSNPGSDYLSPRNPPHQQNLSPHRQVMASIDSTSTAAYSNRPGADPHAAGSYPRGPGSTHSSRAGSARPGSSQPSSPLNSQRNTRTIAAARDMANRVAGSAATSPAALAGGMGGAHGPRGAPMVSPRVKGPDTGMGAIMERARAVKRMESSGDGWGDLGASQDTVGSMN